MKDEVMTSDMHLKPGSEKQIQVIPLPIQMFKNKRKIFFFSRILLTDLLHASILCSLTSTQSVRSRTWSHYTIPFLEVVVYKPAKHVLSIISATGNIKTHLETYQAVRPMLLMC